MRGAALIGRAGFLALLLILGLSQATDAVLSIYLRVSLLSWDSPASQHGDELASQAVPWADAAGESLAHARAGAQTTGPIRALPAAPQLASLALSSGITRSPPTS